jgi:4-amino-4-deoxy-L-arabinose transferase-like glycosyltransferase
MYAYTYLYLSLLFLCIWTVLFWGRKDVRSEMLHVSLLFAFAGPIADYFYFKDWWVPQTMSGSWVSVEAFTAAFALGGVAAVVYEFITHKRLSKKHGSKKVEYERVAVCVVLLVGVFVLTFGLTNSFVATIVSLGCVTVFILYQRKDLFWDSVVSAIALVFIAQAVYALLTFLTPGWVEAFFYFHNVPYMYVGALPIDDFFWYLAAGAAISPMYEYCSSRRFVNGV